MLIVSFLLIGLGAGVLAGMFGIGGGIVIVPLLMFVGRMTPQKATGRTNATGTHATTKKRGNQG